MSGRLRKGDLWRIALRASLLQATWNFERQQGIGWAWALEPALERLYPDPKVRCERLAEHTAYFNTQPTLASLALGAVAALEERRAAGEGLDADAIARVKSVLGSSLAVMSGYRFVRRAAARGIPVAIVTHGPTRGDAQATLRVDAPLGPTLAALADRVDAA